MQVPDDRTIVDVWERLFVASPTRRAVELAALTSGVASDDVARWPIGRRDTALLDARAAMFGPSAPCYVQCPYCAAEHEFEIDLRAIRSAPEPLVAQTELACDRFAITLRLPTSEDLLAIERADDIDDGLGALLARCVVHADLAGDRVESSRLPPTVIDAIAEAIDRSDPGADISFALTCHDCAQPWDAPFDIAAYLWREIDIVARRCLLQVDALARAYGWTEATILGLSSMRRRAYLELVGGV